MVVAVVDRYRLEMLLRVAVLVVARLAAPQVAADTREVLQHRVKEVRGAIILVQVLVVQAAGEKARLAITMGQMEPIQEEMVVRA